MTRNSDLEPFEGHKGRTAPAYRDSDYDLLPASYDDGYLSPTQQDQIRELIANAAAIFRYDASADIDFYDDTRHIDRRQPQPDAGVVIAMFMLVLVTVVAVVAIVAVLAMAANTA